MTRRLKKKILNFFDMEKKTEEYNRNQRTSIIMRIKLWVKTLDKL